MAALGAMMVISQLYFSLTLLLISFSEPVQPLSCGQASCYLLLARLQMPVTMAELDQDFADLKAEASFYELQSVLKKHGLPTTPWKLGWKDFQSIRGPFIAHIDDPKSQFRHYHVAEWRDSELVILDPLATRPIQVGTASGLEAYRKVISGNVLLPDAEALRPWQWRSRLRIGSILLVVGVGTVWVLRKRRTVKFRSAMVAEQQILLALVAWRICLE